MRPDLGARGSRHLSLAIVLLVGVLTIGVGTAPVVAGPTSIDQPVALQQANEPPVADFEYSPAEPEPGQPVVLNASASHDPDGEIVEYRWDLDDDGEVELEAGPNVRVAFPRAGQYPVTLTVVDNDGQTHSITKTVTVGGDIPPTARLTASATELEVGETVTLEATGSSDPDGQIVEWAFDTDGDGEFDEVFDAPTDFRTGYSEPGTYQVTLRVTDNDGLTDTATVEIVVQAAESQPTAPPASPTPTTATSTPTPAAGGGGFFGDLPTGAFLGVLGIVLVVVVVIGGVYYWHSNRRKYPGSRL